MAKLVYSSPIFKGWSASITLNISQAGKLGIDEKTASDWNEAYGNIPADLIYPGFDAADPTTWPEGFDISDPTTWDLVIWEE